MESIRLVARNGEAVRQALAGRSGQFGDYRVCRFPPGTSKWNKIEHQMFCHMSKNWSGTPLVSCAAIVSLIGSTTTTAGLRIKAKLDLKTYPKGIKVTDEELAAANIEKNKLHGEWNYTILPML